MPDHSRIVDVSKMAGGSFLDNLDSEDSASDVFTAEDFSEEQIMIRDMAARFAQDEVLPEQDNLERQNWDVAVRLLKGYAELGLVGIEVPERYGGTGLDRVTAMIVAEQMARVASFAVTCGGQSGIGILPILYFGSEDLRRKYLPHLCSAEKISAYALSEAGSGSDALSARTTAIKSADGKHWVLNGEKMWVTNAAFADIFITFAKVDGKQFSCFLVEKEYAGVTTGAEEHKMGLKGSSTRPVVLTDVHVPIGNLIGEAGKGHEVAFNILNIGRAKLGAAATGGSKTALNDAIAYAKQRMSFDKPISSLGAIQHKLAEMAIRTWVTEAMVYRTASLMDGAMEGVDIDDRAQKLQALKEYAVECSIVKVFGSETLDFVVDEAVQIYGGHGTSSEYPVERYYRDSRVFRIFEGTNEINRLMISGMLLKRVSNRVDSTEPSGPIAAERKTLSQAKIAFNTLNSIVAASGAGQTEQEVLMLLANIAIDIYAMDSAILRGRKLIDGGNSADICIAVVQTFINDAVARVTTNARQVLAAFDPDRVNKTNLSAIEALLGWTPMNTVTTRRRVAEQLLNSGRYALSK